MRSLVFLIIAALLGAPALSACAAQELASVPLQQITVRLMPDQNLLMGESVLDVARSTDTLSLTLNPAAELNIVTVNGAPVTPHRSGALLSVPLPSRRSGQAHRIAITYRCTFTDSAPERPVVTEDTSYGVSGTITPQGTYLGMDAGWYPAPATLPAARSVTVTAPAGTEAITAGRRLAHQTANGVTTSTWKEEHPIENLSLSAGPYLIEERRHGDIPLYAYLFPEHAGLAARYLDAAGQYLAFYSNLFGPYPFEKFAVVENFFPTGYGFPSYTLIGGTVIRLPFIVDTSFPHEIAHCWWGNGVLVDYREGNWAEGLTTYLADYLLEERKSPREGREYRQRFLTDYASLVAPATDFPLQQFVGRVDPASRAIGYGKGAMVFHMVRRQIGDAAFFNALREVFREKRFARAAWSDFIAAFSHTAGVDLLPVVTPWLQRAGGPRLSLVTVTRQRKGDRWVVRGAIQQQGQFPGLPVTIRVETGGAATEQTVITAGDQTSFSLATAQPPQRVLLDPDAHLFRILAADELPATVNRIKGSRELSVIVSETCRAPEATLRLLLRSLGQEHAKLIPEGELSRAALSRSDLLLCGVPRQHELLPRLPATVTLHEDGFSVTGERFTHPGDALFVAGTHHGDPSRVAALFVPRSPVAAEASVLKITHYGRYGLLVFSDGVNRRKETPPAAGGGSVVVFPNAEEGAP